MLRLPSLLLLSFTLLSCSPKTVMNIAVDNRPSNHDEITVYSTAQGTNNKISKTTSLHFQKSQQPLETEICVFVNPQKTFQEFLGIGAAATDASAEVFFKLPEHKRDEFLKAYFDKQDGIGYSLLRVSIHSSDFGSSSFTYIDEGDKELQTFSINKDKEFRIPFIKKAMSTAGGLTLYASPWSPPAFMKDNNSMLQGGKLLPEYYQSWANYYVKFINSYEAEGIPVWGLTVQNEPMAKQRWESCIYTAEEERDFLKNYLGPTLANADLGDKKIIIWDHNRDLINQRVNTILADPEAYKYAWGIGFHWYETWAGGEPMFQNIGKVYESFPEKKLLFTEGCVEKFDSSKYFFWPNAERYGRSMINDFNNGTVGWTDWNILLDETGGPNHKNNLCFAPIHADTRSGELIFTPTYYYIGHFSKFIHPGAKRISTVSSRSQLLSTSFINNDSKIVTVVMNQSDETIKYKLIVGDRMTEIEILPHAIQSLIY